VAILFRNAIVISVFLSILSACSVLNTALFISGKRPSMKSDQITSQISAEELAQALSSSDDISGKKSSSSILSGKNIFLLDVRENEEFERTHIPDSYLVPMMELEDRVDEVRSRVEAADVTVLICRSGQRSEMVASYLHGLGMKNLYNLSGGINAYSIFDPKVIAY